MRAVLKNTGECFQNILSVYDIVNDSTYLPVEFKPVITIPSVNTDFYLTFTYINIHRLTTNYINWNTTTSKLTLPCDPSKGRVYYFYSNITVLFESPILNNLNKLELYVYLGDKNDGTLILLHSGLPQVFDGHELTINNYSNPIELACDTNISNVYFDFIGSRPNQTLKLINFELYKLYQLINYS